MDEFLQIMADTVKNELQPKVKKKNNVLSNVAYGVGRGIADNLTKTRRLPNVPDEHDDNLPEPEL